MEKITLKAYAIKHKMSMFQVVKLVKSGKVKSETIEEEGKKTIYIFDESTMSISDKPEEKKGEKEENSKSLLQRVSQLEKEIVLLKKEIEVLKKQL